MSSCKPQPQSSLQSAHQEWACVCVEGLVTLGFPSICQLRAGGWAQRQEVLGKETDGCAHLPLSASLAAG